MAIPESSELSFSALNSSVIHGVVLGLHEVLGVVHGLLGILIVIHGHLNGGLGGLQGQGKVNGLPVGLPC